MGDNILRIICFFIILATGLSESDTSNEPCATNANNGTCVPISKCPAALSILKHRDLKTISNISCGFENKSPKVCCTLPDSTIVFSENTEETATHRPSKGNTTKQVEHIPLIPDKPLDPLPVRQVCGKLKIQNRIYGGKNTEIGEFPWLARLKYENDLYGCAASLITDRYVITSAHCVQDNGQVIGKPISVRLGEWDEETEKDCFENICNNKPVDVNITNYFFHPEYNVQNKTVHDIALLKLEEPVYFTDFIQPVCLPTTEYVMMQDYLQDSSYWAAGWGLTEYGQTSPIKRKVKLEAVPTKTCEGIFPHIPKTSFPYLICAGGIEGKDTCKGDSGGPLVRQVMENYENNWYLFGITSLGSGRCGTEGLPGFYTRVSKYINWIRDIISKN